MTKEEMAVIMEIQAKQIMLLTNLVSELQQKLDAVCQENADLKERLNKNSQNSSKPPSTDGYKKPNPKSLRKPTGKKQGGQDGHKGHNLKVDIEPSETIQYMPSACTGCPQYKECRGRACIAETRRVADACVRIEVTAHQVLEVACPVHNESLRGQFPENIKAAIQYGENLQSLVVAFSTVGAVSANRIHELFGNVFGIPLSTGTIANMVRHCAENLAEIDEQIKCAVAGLDVAHFDETGTRVDNKLNWVHVASNRFLTYLYLSEKRGKLGMEEGAVLLAFHGIAVHDCWASYWIYGSAHAICCAHLLRELNGILDNHPEQSWAKNFKKLLLDMKKAKDDAVFEGRDALDLDDIARFLKRYNRILRKAYQQNPLPDKVPGKRGRQKRGKIRALIDRLKERKEAVCLFIKNFTVPFDNNQAERDLRMVKVKTKVSGCFRTSDGARYFLRIMSYVGTARKQGVRPFEAILKAVSGKPQIFWLEQGC